MKRLSLTLGALVLGALCTHAASADTFSFSFSGTAPQGGSAFGGSGTLVTSTGVGNQYQIQSASGSIDGSASIKLLDVGVFGSNDNVLYDPGFMDGSQGPFNFDNAGVSFELDNGNGHSLGDVNLFQDASGYFHVHYYEAAFLDPSGDGHDVQESITNLSVTDTTPSAVPEPGSLALFSTGILGLAGVLRRKLAA